MATKAVVAKKFNTDYLYGNKPLSHYKAAFYEAAHTSGASSKYLYTSVRCHYTNTNIIHALKGISTPICILQGESSSNSDSIAIQYETLCPAIENIVVIPNTAGMPHIEKPSSITRVAKVMQAGLLLVVRINKEPNVSRETFGSLFILYGTSNMPIVLFSSEYD